MDPKHLVPWMLVIATLLVAAPTTAGTAPEAQEHNYIGGSSHASPSAITIWCTMGLSVSVGGACFDRPPGSDTVSFAIHDSVTPTPGGWVYFRDDQGQLLNPTVHFCTSGFTREIPAGTQQIVVQFWDPAHHDDNPLCSVTSGTIRAAFF